MSVEELGELPPEPENKVLASNSSEYAHTIASLARGIFSPELPLEQNWLEAKANQHWKEPSIYDTAQLLRLPDDVVLDSMGRNNLFRKVVFEGRDGKEWWGDASVNPHSALLDTLGVLHLLHSPNDFGSMQGLEAIKEEGWKAVNKLYKMSSADNYPKHETVALEQLVVPYTEFVALSEAYQSLDVDTQTRVMTTLDSLDEEAKGFYKTLKKSQAKKMELMRQLSSDGHPSNNPDNDIFFPEDTTAAYTLEALELLHQFGVLGKDSADIWNIEAHSNSIGGVALSPAATVSTIHLMQELGIPVPNEHYEYLNFALNSQRGEGVAGTIPFRITDLFWPLVTLHVNKDAEVLENDELLATYGAILNHNYFKRVNGGIPWDFAQTIPDLDDTVVVLSAVEDLKMAETAEDYEISDALNYRLVDNFQEGLHYVCYKGEMTTSPSHLYHLLFYLEKVLQNGTGVRAEVETMRDMCLTQIRDVVSTDPFSAIDDKWYTGEGYGLLRVFSSDAMVYQVPELISLLVDRVQTWQNRDGGDGGFGTLRHEESIIEESIYIYNALYNLHKKISDDWSLQDVYANEFGIVENLLHETEAFIENEFGQGNYGQNDPALWIGKGTYESLVIKKSAIASYNRIKHLRYQRSNGSSLSVNPLGYALRPMNYTKRRLMDSTEKLWSSILKLGRGERDHGYARNARVIAHYMVNGTGVDIYYAMPASSDPPAFNKISEKLAEESPELNQYYTQILNYAANPANWGNLTIDNPSLGDFDQIIMAAEAEEEGLGEIIKQSAVHIALIGQAGREAIDDQDIRSQWEEAYQNEVVENYAQELKKGQLPIDEIAGDVGNPINPIYGDSPDDSEVSEQEYEIVQEYLAELGKTSALGVALAGAMVHLPVVDLEIIEFLNGDDFREIINISRLVQDAKSVDPTERDNVGMRLLRAMRSLSIKGARDLLTEDYIDESLHGFQIKDTLGAERRKNISERLMKIYETKYLGKLENMLVDYKDNQIIAQLIRNQIEVNEMILRFKEQGNLI